MGHTAGELRHWIKYKNPWNKKVNIESVLLAFRQIDLAVTLSDQVISRARM
jgi:hypothetical protein